MQKIEEGVIYRLKRDNTSWIMVGIEYPLGSKDPKLGRVFLEEKDGTSGIMVAADTFWKNFEKYLED